MIKAFTQLAIPAFFRSQTVGKVWQVPYQERAAEAKAWAEHYNIKPAVEDKTRVCLLAVDVQNTFCIPGFELFVGGKSGVAAVEDNVRLCEFIYHYLGAITEIILTMDTHTAMQIFHPLFWVNEVGEYPPVYTNISREDVERGVWKVNPAVANNLNEYDYLALQQYALHYVKKLERDSKYTLTVWPYHALLGGVSHALVSAVAEAIFFHNIARGSQTHIELKGSNPLTENYSVLQPEVIQDANGKPIAQKNTHLLEKLISFDVLLIAGQAKSHCVVWTVEDLLAEITHRDRQLTNKVYLLEDCTSPIVIDKAVDYTQQADAAFQRFAEAGMHRIKSTDPIPAISS